MNNVVVSNFFETLTLVAVMFFASLVERIVSKGHSFISMEATTLNIRRKDNGFTVWAQAGRKRSCRPHKKWNRVQVRYRQLV